MRLDWLRAFRAVMQTGTVTGAAAVMLRTQPQVSRMISSLEGSLDLRLFSRDGRRLIPTEEGLQFFQYVEPLLFGLDGARNVAEDIKHKRGRPLVITAEPFLLHALLPEAIRALSERWDLKYAVDICVRGLGLWMSRSNADLAVVALPFSQTDMDRLIFAEAEVVLVLPPGHALAAREIVDFPDLRHERFVALRPSTLLRAQIDIAAAQAGVSINPVLEAASGAAACELVARGLGVTLADPIVAASFRSAGVSVKRMSTNLRLTYGYLIPRGSESIGQISRVMYAVADAAARLGGEYVTVDASWQKAVA
ncbi:MAG TPA: LysR substrate-binding domain-containing protein [Xanthobacteraceae bacterium]|nr:LysR substrate-binding domain-containing protein [Xanthobacteraceae bacterium]